MGYPGQTRLGQGAAAARLFASVNPINHALTAEDVGRYKVEPYVVAADIYSTPLHEGRGGWTWYTGLAAWMLRAGIEGILGLTRHGDHLQFNPCLPPDWPEVVLSLRFGQRTCQVTVRNAGSGHGITSARLNSRELSCNGGLKVALCDLSGELVLHVGEPVA